MASDQELELFKQTVSLAQYIADSGYVLDKSKSSKSSAVFRGGNSEKYLVMAGSDGHEVFTDLHRSGVHGSIVDFVMAENGCNLGQARVILRRYLGTERPKSQAANSFSILPNSPQASDRPDRPDKSDKTVREPDRQKAEIDWKAAKIVSRPFYLVGRGLDRSLRDKRFSDRFRVSRRGHILFSHYDRQGMTGYAMRGDGFKGFMEGGNKALWRSNRISEAKRIYICESEIDAMSHAELFYDPLAAYVSFAGQISSAQLVQLSTMFEYAISTGKTVICATDNDKCGDDYYKIFQDLSAPRDLDRVIPSVHKDWNDQLKEKLGI